MSTGWVGSFDFYFSLGCVKKVEKYEDGDFKDCWAPRPNVKAMNEE